jgi:uncharacterized membrane protein
MLFYSINVCYCLCICILASVVFMEQVIKEERRLLAVFPVFFFYTFIGWMILLQ